MLNTLSRNLWMMTDIRAMLEKADTIAGQEFIKVAFDQNLCTKMVFIEPNNA